LNAIFHTNILFPVGKGFAISTSAGQVGTFYTNNFELFDKVIQQLQEAIAKESELKVQELQRRRQVTPSTQINQT
jgi:prefoldin subunit 5